MYLDGYPSRSEVYMSIHPDGYPSGSPLKDRSSFTLTARSHPSMGPTLVVTRASKHLTLDQHDNTTLKLGASPLGLTFAGTIGEWIPFGNYIPNHSKHLGTNTTPRADTTSQISNRQDLNNTCVKNSLLYYEIFSITSIQLQSVNTSNKSDTSFNFVRMCSSWAKKRRCSLSRLQLRPGDDS